MLAAHSNGAVPSPEQAGPGSGVPYRAKAHVQSAVRAGDTWLLDTERGLFYPLNDVSARIWTLLKRGMTLSALVERLSTEYDVTRTLLETDAAAVLDAFMAAGLIERMPRR